MKKVIVILLIFVLFSGCAKSNKVQNTDMNVTEKPSTPVIATPTSSEYVPEIHNELSSGKLKWGMSREEIEKSLEIKMKYYDAPNKQGFGMYSSKLFNIKTGVSFHFKNNKLDSIIEIDLEGPDININDYNIVKQEFIKKYGEPIKNDSQYWMYSTSKTKIEKDPEKVQEAFDKGEMQFETAWKTDTLSVDMLYGKERDQKNQDTNLYLKYQKR